MENHKVGEVMLVETGLSTPLTIDSRDGVCVLPFVKMTIVAVGIEPFC